MTDARVTQHTVEILTQDLAPLARVTQHTVEVLRSVPNPDARVTQVTVEVLRNIPTLSSTGSGWGLPLDVT